MKRIASLLLAVTFSIVSFAGCTPKKEPVIESLPDQLVPPEEINEDDPWFYNSLQDISNVHDSGEYDFITNKYLGSDEEGILILTIANKNWDGLDYENYNSIDYQFGFIDYCTFDGELINSFAINDTYQDNKKRFHLSTINTDEQFVIEDGQIVVRLSAFPVSAYDPYKVLEMSVDYRNGTHSEWEEVDETIPMEVLKVDNKLTFENRYVWGDYSAEVYVNDFTYDDCSCYIVVNKPDGSSFSVNSRDKLPDLNIVDWYNRFTDGKFAIPQPQTDMQNLKTTINTDELKDTTKNAILEGMSKVKVWLDGEPTGKMLTPYIDKNMPVPEF